MTLENLRHLGLFCVRLVSGSACVLHSCEGHSRSEPCSEVQVVEDTEGVAPTLCVIMCMLSIKRKTFFSAVRLWRQRGVREAGISLMFLALP